MSNLSSRSSDHTFSSPSSKPPADAPQRSGVGTCQKITFPWRIVDAIRSLDGCHCSIALETLSVLNRGVHVEKFAYMDVDERVPPRIEGGKQSAIIDNSIDKFYVMPHPRASARPARI